MTTEAPKRPSMRPKIQDLKQSRTGKRPVDLPKGVTAVVKDGKIDVRGRRETCHA